ELTERVGVARGTVYHVHKSYGQKGHAPLLALRPEAARRGRPMTLESQVEAKPTRIACSAPPPGRSRWTRHLIADKLVELAGTESSAHERVRRRLQKPTSSRG